VGKVDEESNRPKKISLISLATSRAEYIRRKLTKACYGIIRTGRKIVVERLTEM
jgi:hypothetical protein